VSNQLSAVSRKRIAQPMRFKMPKGGKPYGAKGVKIKVPKTTAKKKKKKTAKKPSHKMRKR
jgi:hypothetical protein